LFLLGHTVWSYFFSKATGEALHYDLQAYLAFYAGILPDYDLYFSRLGLVHHTYTHSLLLIGPSAIALSLLFKEKGVAFSAGLLSHLYTDMLVGGIPILYPLSTASLGLNLGIPSAADSVLEVGMLLGVLLYMSRNGDLLTLVSKDSKNLYLLLPLLSIVSLSLLFSQDNNIQLATYAFSRTSLSVISIGHIVLGLVLGIGVVQGIRSFWKAAPTGRGEARIKGIRNRPSRNAGQSKGTEIHVHIAFLRRPLTRSKCPSFEMMASTP
jgi:hypothetical protein